MAVTTKVIRVANPRKGRGRFRLRTARRKNAARGKKRMTAKQIKFFGTARQRAGLKAARKRKALRAHKPARRRNSSRPKVKVIYRSRPRKKVRTRRANPGLVVTLGSVNPRKRRKNPVAKMSKAARRKAGRKAARTRKRRAAASHRPRRTRKNRTRRRNARKVYVVNPRRTRRRNRRRTVHHNRKHRRMNSRRRRNPQLFGRSSPKDLLTLVGGGLVGVTVTKMIPSYVPSSITSMIPSGGIGAVLISGVSAFAAGWLAGKVNKEFGEAVLFGGLMQTGSVALNAFLPSVGGTFSLGDLINGQYVVPQNPILMGNNTMSVSSAAARGMSAYGPAY